MIKALATYDRSTMESSEGLKIDHLVHRSHRFWQKTTSEQVDIGKYKCVQKSLNRRRSRKRCN